VALGQACVLRTQAGKTWESSDTAVIFLMSGLRWTEVYSNVRTQWIPFTSVECMSLSLVLPAKVSRIGSYEG